MIDSFSLPTRAAEVNRWAGKHLIGRRMNISEHSFEVAFYSLLLYQLVEQHLEDAVSCKREADKAHYIGNRAMLKIVQAMQGEVLEYALVHDIAEIVTGDIPHDVKKSYPEFKSLLKQIEADFMRKHLPAFMKTYDPLVVFIVKAADTYAAFREYLQEEKYGNTLPDVYENIIEAFETLFDTEPDVPQICKKSIWGILLELGAPVPSQLQLG